MRKTRANIYTTILVKQQQQAFFSHDSPHNACWISREKQIASSLRLTYFSVWPWKLYKALARNCGLLASLLAASSSSLLLLSSSASYSLLNRSSSCLLLNLSSSSSRLLLSSSSLRLCSSSSLLLRAASSSRLLNRSSSDGGCCRICSSSDAVRVGPWVEYQKQNYLKNYYRSSVTVFWLVLATCKITFKLKETWK